MYPLFVRLTIENSKEEVMAVLQTMPNRYLKAVICEEEAKRHHLHILTLTPEENTKNARQNVRNLLKKAFPILKDNATWSISKVYTDTIDRMGSYVVKEGNFCQYGFSEEEIALFKVNSFAKPQQDKSYKEELKQIQKETDIKIFMNKLLDLRKKNDKNTTYNQLKNIVEWQLIKTDKQFENRIKNRVLTDLGFTDEHIVKEWHDNEIIRETTFRAGIYP